MTLFRLCSFETVVFCSFSYVEAQKLVRCQLTIIALCGEASRMSTCLAYASLSRFKWLPFWQPYLSNKTFFTES